MCHRRHLRLTAMSPAARFRLITPSAVMLAGLVLLGFSTTHATTYYLSPSGSDARAGTSPSAPWRTFRHAIPQLDPGDTLMLMDGTYRGSNSGYPHINCDGSANHGTASNPITLKAQHERRAFLQGDGSAAPFLIQNCSYWNIQGLRAENGDFSGRSGGTVFTVRASDHIALRRNLGAKNNRYMNSDIFLVRSSRYILLEENEAYSFHRHGISVSQSALITLRRNYVNSRGYADIPGGRPSHSGAQTRGDEGITFYSGDDSIAENNIDEENEMFATHGQRNLFVGNVTLGSLWGFFVGHHCCNSESVRDHRLINNASISSGGPNYLEQSAVNTLVDQHTSYGSQDSHGAAGTNKRSSQNGAYPWTVFPSTTIRNSLFVNNRATGLRILHAEDYAFRVLDHLNAFGNRAGNYSLGTETRTNSTSIDPQLGACRVFLPDRSPMKGAGKGGTDIGANILYVYENGELTDSPLWRPGSGHFPCGARVPGVNDRPGRSCFDVHQRLNVHTNGCALPAGYAGAWPPRPGPLPR
jgi:hypothetical protein